MNFEFATATKIIFGPGTIVEAAPNVKLFGKCALVVCGRNMNRAAQLFHQLEEQEIKVVPFQVSGEPAISLASEGVNLARSRKCAVVIGSGNRDVCHLFDQPGAPE
jgi:alcohol dehydrogenase class IV